MAELVPYAICVRNVQSDRVRIETARNGAKRLKLTRHPNVVHLRESLEVEKGDELTIYMVTEAVMPLEEHLRDLSTVTHQRDEYFALGLRQVATAVSFLSNDCKLVHGGVSMAAVMVTDRLDWKLGGFDLLSDLASVGRGSLGDARIVHSGFMVPDQYKPEEYRRGDWASVPEGPPWAIDAWGLGCLIQEVYRGEPLGRHGLQAPFDGRRLDGDVAHLRGLGTGARPLPGARRGPRVAFGAARRRATTMTVRPSSAAMPVMPPCTYGAGSSARVGPRSTVASTFERPHTARAARAAPRRLRGHAQEPLAGVEEVPRVFKGVEAHDVRAHHAGE